MLDGWQRGPRACDGRQRGLRRAGAEAPAGAGSRRMEAAGVRRGVGSVEAALLPLHQLFARRTAAKPPAVAAAAVADDWSVMARLEKPGAMKRSRAAIRFNEPRSRGSRSLRGSRAVHCAIRQILKERHRGWVRTGASVREGRTPFFSDPRYRLLPSFFLIIQEKKESPGKKRSSYACVSQELTTGEESKCTATTIAFQNLSEIR